MHLIIQGSANRMHHSGCWWSTNESKHHWARQRMKKQKVTGLEMVEQECNGEWGKDCNIMLLRRKTDLSFTNSISVSETDAAIIQWLEIRMTTLIKTINRNVASVSFESSHFLSGFQTNRSKSEVQIMSSLTLCSHVSKTCTVFDINRTLLVNE